MSSIGGILNSARSAIAANQAAVRVASENIANAQTEGYSRKRAELTQGPVERTPYGWLGAGVAVTGVTRARDGLLDGVFRRESSRAAGYEMRERLVGQVEEVFGEPSDSGLAATIDAFWGAWSDLANQPGSDVARRLVRQRGEHLAATLQDLTARLDELADGGRARLVQMAGEVGSLGRQIADLNRAVLSTRTGGGDSADLLDRRDQLVDRLSELGGVRVVDRANGTVAVSFEGASLVDGTVAREVVASTTPPSVRVGAATLAFDGEPGALAEVLALLTREVPEAQAGLDELAAGLVSRVNAVHRTGYTTDDATGIDFFDPSATTARSIRLSTAVAADHTRVAASSKPAPDADNRVALDMANLRSDGSAVGGSTFGGFYRDLVTRVATKVHDAAGSATVYRTLVSRVDARRQSVSGVSTDEELVRLTQHQQAYMAAAKVVTAVDEMLQSILNMA